MAQTGAEIASRQDFDPSLFEAASATPIISPDLPDTRLPSTSHIPEVIPSEPISPMLLNRDSWLALGDPLMQRQALISLKEDIVEDTHGRYFVSGEARDNLEADLTAKTEKYYELSGFERSQLSHREVWVFHYAGEAANPQNPDPEKAIDNVMMYIDPHIKREDVKAEIEKEAERSASQVPYGAYRGRIGNYKGIRRDQYEVEEAVRKIRFEKREAEREAQWKKHSPNAPFVRNEYSPVVARPEGMDVAAKPAPAAIPIEIFEARLEKIKALTDVQERGSGYFDEATGVYRRRKNSFDLDEYARVHGITEKEIQRMKANASHMSVPKSGRPERKFTDPTSREIISQNDAAEYWSGDTFEIDGRTFVEGFKAAELAPTRKHRKPRPVPSEIPFEIAG